MPQSLSQVLLHLIFSTKNRLDMIPLEVETDLYAYIASVCRRNGCDAFRVGGTINHIHIACNLGRTITIAHLIEKVKSSSSTWMKKDKGCHDFAWQAGYAAFSLGHSQRDQIVRYIERQREHHQGGDYKEEIMAFLKRYDVQYDEHFLWD